METALALLVLGQRLVVVLVEAVQTAVVLVLVVVVLAALLAQLVEQETLGEMVALQHHLSQVLAVVVVLRLVR
tara:strand:- start:324 stop:542 length:219 start_codon:yes stop_codon:yes gene_type:complete